MTRRKAKGRGRPTKYDPAFCDDLLEHMRRGKTFESFAGKLDVCRDTLYEWMRRHPDFSDARKRGLPLLELHYLEMGQAIAAGQMRRVESESPAMGPDGKPLVDPRTGKVLMTRTYTEAKPNAAAFIFLTKNLLGWTDRRDLNVAGQPGGAPIKIEMTREQRLAEIERLRKSRKECGDD